MRRGAETAGAPAELEITRWARWRQSAEYAATRWGTATAARRTMRFHCETAGELGVYERAEEARLAKDVRLARIAHYGHAGPAADVDALYPSMADYVDRSPACRLEPLGPDLGSRERTALDFYPATGDDA